jgi:hypothetical protein
MKTSAGNFLPWNTVNGEFSGAIDPNAPDMANDAGKTVKTFAAGDVRAAEHPGIAGLHTIFVREHNRICDRLVKEGLKNDELIYQMARKEVGALIQAITYQEFLPAIGINLSSYAGYRVNARPISRIFLQLLVTGSVIRWLPMIFFCATTFARRLNRVNWIWWKFSGPHRLC